MARTVVLGNNSLTVGLNEFGLVHDFYYPFVGLENLTTARMQPHHIGVWVDGVFSWIDDGSWKGVVDFDDNALITTTSLHNESLGLTIHFSDFVDCDYDIFARKLVFENHRDDDRKIRVFFHQVFQISALGRSDTVMYVPDGNYMLDYKGRCSILAYAETASGAPFDQYAAGNAGIEGKEGTFRDSEDGELSMSAVEHGGVDSTIRVCVDVPAQGIGVVHYWLCVADSQTDLETMHALYAGGGFDERKQETESFWHDWLHTATLVDDVYDQKNASAIKKSLMVIKAHTDSNGGIIASCDSSIYNYGRDYYSYVWPRDGAYVMWPLIKLGYTEEPLAFFSFCADIMHPDGYLMHKYQPDKAIGSTWHPLVHGKRKELAIQEDETAIVVFMLSEYLKINNDPEVLRDMYDRFVKPACDFMVRFIDDETGLPHASYDLWEEKFLTSTYTTAIVQVALERATEMAAVVGTEQDFFTWRKAASALKTNEKSFFSDTDGHLIKGFLFKDGEKTVDNVLDISSAYGAWRFGYSPMQHVAFTVAKLEERLLDVSPSGGLPRYENDGYFKSEPAHKGNPWFVATLWLAQFYAEIGKKEDATRLLDWTMNHALPSGVLSEQVNPNDGSIISVTPLVWSHAELINTIIDIYGS